MSKTYDIIALGELLIDFTPMGRDDDGDVMFARKAGGAPLNLLGACAKFGGRTAFVGKVGADMFGDFLIETVKKSGVDASALRVDSIHNTTMAFVQLSENGDRDFTFARRFGADTFLSADEVPEDKLRDTRVFHFGSLSFTSPVSADATRRALDIARRSGAMISYDPNFRPPLWESAEQAADAMRENLTCADLVKASREEVALVAGTDTTDEGIAAGLRYVHGLGVRLCVVTDGPNPVTVSLNGETSVVVPEPRKCVDTTGAGDIFFGTFLSCLLREDKTLETLTLEDCVRYADAANHVSGLSTLKHGAIASIPEIPAEWRIR